MKRDYRTVLQNWRPCAEDHIGEPPHWHHRNGGVLWMTGWELRRLRSFLAMCS